MSGSYNITITDGNNCTVVGTAVIPDDNNLNVNTNLLGVSCIGEEDGIIEITDPTGLAWTYSLDGINFQSSPIFENLPAGDYTVYMTDGVCDYETDVSISQGGDFDINIIANPGVEITQGSSVDLEVVNLPPNVASIEWDNAQTLTCNNCPDPTAIPDAPTTYTVTVIDENGCISTAFILLTFPCRAGEVEIPNAFTPDGDGVNDDFGPVLPEGLEMVSSMKIFDRWGEKVYESSGNNARWDGTIKGKRGTSDVYVYIIRILCTGEGEEQYHGDVTLIR